MANDRRSFRSPYYAQLTSQVEQKLGLPRGLLHGIVTRGERSNADQVSSAGARTVFQIIPQTRAAAIKKWGIDPYLSPENAAEVAGRLLQESLQRNNGSIEAAVGEYHGGPDRRRWGPVNRAYRQRVLGREFGRQSKPYSRRPNLSGPSTFDRVNGSRARERDTGPSIAKVYAAYRSGKMSPEERRAFEADVNSGAIMLPRGAALARQPSAQTLPEGVIEAYNSGRMPEGERRLLDEDLKEGLVALPRGRTLQEPPARTVGDNLALGVRGVVEGAADLAGIVANPLNSVLNATGLPQAVTGAPLATDLGTAVTEALTDAGLPEVRPEEELTNSIIRGGTGGLGAAAVARGVAKVATSPVTREVARIVGDSPVIDTVSGAASGAGGEMGGLPGAVAGGLTPVGAVGAARAVAGRLGRATKETAGAVADQVAERFPRAAIMDDAGELTEEGAEIAARTNLEPGQIMAGYRRSQGRSRQVNDNSPVPIADEAPSPAPDQAPPGLPPTRSTAPAPAADPNPRFAEAQAEGVKLTRGQAEQSFEVQSSENTLRNSTGPEAEEARQFFEQQRVQIEQAVERFRLGFGDTEANATERGAIVKEAIRDLRDQGKAGVNALYRQAEQLGGEGLKIETAPIVDQAKRVLVEADVPEQVKGVIRQELAKHRLIGTVENTAEDGLTTVKLTDGRKVQFYGEPKELTVANAEEFRKAISAQYMADGPRKLSQQLKATIDDAVEEAIERGARGEAGEVGEAYQAARAAHREQKQTFGAKDVIQRLIDFKKGTDTDVVLPEGAIKAIFAGGKEGLTNLKKVKALLLSKGTDQTRQAWAAIQAQGIAEIFDKAVVRNSRIGGDTVDAISGAKLKSAIEAFGIDKLKVLLEEREFAQLMKLNRIIGNATVPVSGTTNPSGSGYAIIRWLSQGALRFVPFAGQIGEVGAALVRKARDVAETTKTLRGIKDYDGSSETAARFNQQARDFIREYIEAGKSGRLLPTGLTAGGGVEAD